MIVAADPVSPFVEAAAKVSSAWSLAAFGIAALIAVAVATRHRGPTPPILWAVVGAITVLGVVPVLARAYVDTDRHPPTPDVYRPRAIVLDAHGTPVDDARVHSDVGGEWFRAADAYQVVIPEATLPASRQLVVRAERPSAFEHAVDSVTLGADHYPKLTLQLRVDQGAMVRGTVVDAKGIPVAGARVSVDGYAEEGATTDAGGGFALAAHAADGQQVLLRAVKAGVSATTLYHPAGSAPATLQLDRVAPP